MVPILALHKQNQGMKKNVVIAEDDRLLAIVLKKMATFMNFEVLDTSQGVRMPLNQLCSTSRI